MHHVQEQEHRNQMQMLEFISCHSFTMYVSKGEPAHTAEPTSSVLTPSNMHLFDSLTLRGVTKTHHL